MIRRRNMLMIGSAGSNTGKTELACTFLKRFAADFDIVGIKVTTVSARDGQCPRGGKGCGVCSSIEGNFSIVEEKNPNTNKDTSRVLAAGTGRVFWLRVLREHLTEGARALFDLIGPETITICESNSLRNVVEPDLFLIVVRQAAGRWKTSAGQVRDYADRVIESNGVAFDLDLEQVKLTKARWTITEQATAIVLAGGKSNRMGTDKAMLPINARPMIEVICDQLRDSFEQILISTANETQLEFLKLPIIKDKLADQGPLAGIASALEASENDLNFVIACDIPFVDLHLVRKMLRAATSVDIVMPKNDKGLNEPLFAIYRKGLLPVINDVLSSDRRKISDIFPHCNVKFIDLQARQIANLNTRRDFERFAQQFRPV